VEPGTWNALVEDQRLSGDQAYQDNFSIAFLCRSGQDKMEL
jgi:hypothetical protein